MPKQLPAPFEGFAKYSDWIVATEGERIEKRLTASMEEMKALYADVIDQLEPIIRYLEGRPVTDVPEEDENLVRLVFALIEVGQAVEIYEQGAVVDGADVRLFTSVLERPIADPAHV
ncbi:hypothetical protein [Rhodococcus zopfii]|uniref:Small subunit of 2-hydroxypyridine dioxygenase n=1 Tax=Rhodococcus sp. PY11 TaxID=551544 RepID=B5MAD5_9NOCA|nr:hypothetical protein [Rhodococcus zopfii]CAR47863.1 small subunit of 2-hydroxypyridine dioxygenase [Rhodococcus sp. PY11]